MSTTRTSSSSVVDHCAKSIRTLDTFTPIEIQDVLTTYEMRVGLCAHVEHISDEQAKYRLDRMFPDGRYQLNKYGGTSHITNDDRRFKNHPKNARQILAALKAAKQALYEQTQLPKYSPDQPQSVPDVDAWST